MENIQSTTTSIATYFYIAGAFIILILIFIKRESIKKFLDELPIALMYSALIGLPILIIFVIIEMIFWV